MPDRIVPACGLSAIGRCGLPCCAATPHNAAHVAADCRDHAGPDAAGVSARVVPDGRDAAGGPALLARSGASRRAAARPFPCASPAAADRAVRCFRGCRGPGFRRCNRRLCGGGARARGYLDQPADRAIVQRSAWHGVRPFGRKPPGRPAGWRALWRGDRRSVLRREHVQRRARCLQGGAGASGRATSPERLPAARYAVRDRSFGAVRGAAEIPREIYKTLLAEAVETPAGWIDAPDPAALEAEIRYLGGRWIERNAG